MNNKKRVLKINYNGENGKNHIEIKRDEDKLYIYTKDEEIVECKIESEKEFIEETLKEYENEKNKEYELKEFFKDFNQLEIGFWSNYGIAIEFDYMKPKWLEINIYRDKDIIDEKTGKKTKDININILYGDDNLFLERIVL